jgi:hypothetical protein
MISSRQGAVMAQLRRIFYYSINLAATLIPQGLPYCGHKVRNGDASLRFCTDLRNMRTGEPKMIGIRTVKPIAKTKQRVSRSSTEDKRRRPI